MPHYDYLRDDQSFDGYMARMSGGPGRADTGAAGRDPVYVATDIEAEMNLHVYGERFCLLQVFDGNRPAVVDPFSVSIAKIRNFFEDPVVIKICYDAAADRSLLYKAHGILLKGIIDLKPAVEILGLAKQGLDSVLTEILGLEPETGKSRFQQYNWTRRPIRPDALDYALRDVLYLFRLKDELFARLEGAGKMADYLQENARREGIVPDVERLPGVFRTRRFERLPKSAQQEFHRIYDLRERLAERLDLPPHLVLAKDDLFALAAGTLAASALRRPGRVSESDFEALRRQIAAGGGS